MRRHRRVSQPWAEATGQLGAPLDALGTVASLVCMSPSPDESALEESLARERERRGRYAAHLQRLRDSDPVFAGASAVHPVDHTQWQSAVYLLTGCRPVWRALGGPILATRSIAPVNAALARGRPGPAGIERALLMWATHLWDPARPPAGYPEHFSEFYFRRWVDALHLRHRLAPHE